jgi:hypothetical protein
MPLHQHPIVFVGNFANFFLLSPISSPIFDIVVEIARIALSFVTLFTVVRIKPCLRLWQAACLLGTILLASFASTGHGASTEGAGGTVHLITDIARMISAGVWLSALLAFLAFLRLQKLRMSNIHRHCLMPSRTSPRSARACRNTCRFRPDEQLFFS